MVHDCGVDFFKLIFENLYKKMISKDHLWEYNNILKNLLNQYDLIDEQLTLYTLKS